MPDPDTLTHHLNRLVAERQTVLDQVIAAARDAGAGALLLIGSLGRGGGDPWSDLDLIVVPGPTWTGLDLSEFFGERILATVEAPRNAPIGGSYLGLCLDIPNAALWLDVYVWPAATSAVPADATAVFDDLGLPASELEFIPLITAHSDPCAPAHPATAVTTLLRVAVAAKYFARGDRDRLVRKLPDAAGVGLDGIPRLLHGLLAAIDDPTLARAVAATRRLVDLAAAAGLSSHSGRLGEGREHA